MIFTETKLSGVFIIEMEQITDHRGFFSRLFCKKEYHENGVQFEPVQSNFSYSKYRYTLRGLHYQDAPFREAKLVRCTRGSIFDVALDLRKDSPTYMNWISVELNDENQRTLFVPEGIAHGFMTLQHGTEVTYHVSEYYTPGEEKGIRWDDPAFDINWPADPQKISQKDQNWPDFSNHF
jgi:dTDP-4-dehydrorhamnose 3,5-epimerase